VRGRGYRFVAELAEGAAAPSLARSTAANLIGRDELYARASTMLDDVGVLSLVGPGGVGKTAIADALAESRSGSPDGVITVLLAAVDVDDAVVAAIRSAANLTDATSIDAVAATLAGLDGLLVLDNCEHLLDPIARFVDQLVKAPGPLRVLVTSRERLGVRGEQVLPVDVLAPEAARALFVDRATAVQPSFARDDDDPVLDEIVRALDCLPLAIEMAACRASAIGLADLRDLILAERSVLDSPHRTADPRHRTLDDLVRWSERLLDDEGRRTMAEFSVFAQAVGTEDLVGVLGGGRPGATASVARLVDRSLVVAHVGGQRPTTYSMLATIRAYAARQRSPGTDRRHAEWFTSVAEEANRMLRGPDEATADARLGAIADELRAAHQWARREDPPLAARLTGALDLYAHSRLWPEPAEWAAALESDLDACGAEAAKVRAALAAEAAHRGDYERAVALAASAAEAADPRVRISAWETLSDVATYNGDLSRSIAGAQQLLALGTRHADLHAVALGITSLTLALVYNGDAPPDRTMVGDLRVADLSPSDRAWLAYREAECCVASDHRVALNLYREAIELGASVNNRFVNGVATVSRLALQARVGDPNDALADFEPVLREYRRTGSASHCITALRNLISLLVRIGDDEIAMRLLAALSGPEVKATYGDESDRLADARHTCSVRHGDAVVERWSNEAAGQGHRWALEAAIGHLAAREARG
jgi:predicted ATPase